jgi:protein-S-isoprenylcysteine O-methyltransferase Ste14
MSTDVAHKSRWETADVVFGAPLLSAIVLQRAAPLSFPGRLPAPARVMVGVLLIILGVALVALARRELARRGQPTDPGQPTSAIVTTGVFAISRNPLYLGVVCFLVGVALAAYLPWLLALLLPALVACHYILIVPEERYLSARFGAEYRVYVDSVHRWIGRARRAG